MFRHAPAAPHILQFLAEDAKKFIPCNYLRIWPKGSLKKAVVLRFRNESPRVVELHSGFDSLSHDIALRDDALVIRATVTGADAVPIGKIVFHADGFPWLRGFACKLSFAWGVHSPRFPPMS